MPVFAPAATDPLKAGWQTTEFWTAGVAPFVISLLTVFNIGHVDLTHDPRVHAIIVAASLLASAIGAAFYAHSRGHMKAGAAVKSGLESLGSNLPTLGASAKAIDPALFDQVATEIQKVDPMISAAQLDVLKNLIASEIKTHLSPPVVPAPVQPSNSISGNTLMGRLFPAAGGEATPVVPPEATPADVPMPLPITTSGSFQAPTFS